jgi:hypothetical protein
MGMTLWEISAGVRLALKSFILFMDQDKNTRLLNDLPIYGAELIYLLSIVYDPLVDLDTLKLKVAVLLCSQMLHFNNLFTTDFLDWLLIY